MFETCMKRQGYKYYVYSGPGNISYFETLEEAEDYAEEVEATVKKVD